MAKNSQNDENKKTENSNESIENKTLENSNKPVENTNIDEVNKLQDNNNENTSESINNNNEENCKCCNDGCKCGDCGKCSDGGSCSIGGKKCCAKKLILVLSLAACVLSVMALNKANNICALKEIDNIEERIKTEVKDVITKNPQLILDAISKGLVDKRDNIMKQSAVNVEANKTDVIKSAIRVGDPNAKVSTICFFDPTGVPCKEAQKIIAGMIKNNKSICCYLLPVSILGENSEKVTVVYYQLQELDKQKLSTKLLDFLQEITKEGATVDKVLDIIKVNKHELNKYLEIAKTKMASNRELLEKLKISSLPAVFISKYKEKYEIIHDYNLLSKLV